MRSLGKTETAYKQQHSWEFQRVLVFYFYKLHNDT